MKKLIILFAIAALVQSCTWYSDKDQNENPRMVTVEYLQSSLNSVFRTIEITDFFDRYQTIREDRNAALVLGRWYFGDSLNEEELVYEGYWGGLWGIIRATSEPGRYIVTPYNYSQDIIYYVEVTEERKYIIRTKPKTKDVGPIIPDFTIWLECIASIRDNEMIIENMDLEYIENNGRMETNARITSTSDPAMMHLCKEGVREPLPYSGTLNYEVKNRMTNDKFSVKYSETKKYEIL